MHYINPKPYSDTIYPQVGDPIYPINPNSIPKVPGVPVIPPLPHPKRREFHAQCGECGIMIPNGPWMYSCHNGRCPVQPKVTF